jgi:hypothetical protein
MERGSPRDEIRAVHAMEASRNYLQIDDFQATQSASSPRVSPARAGADARAALFQARRVPSASGLQPDPGKAARKGANQRRARARRHALGEQLVDQLEPPAEITSSATVRTALL